VFAYLFNPQEQWQNLIFPRSLRRYGGLYSQNRIICLIPEGLTVEAEIKHQIQKAEVDLVYFEIDAELSQFPLASFPIAAAEAEAMVDPHSLLVWQTFDTIIMQEPKQYDLPLNIQFGYRPVHHTVVGSVYEKPLDNFWKTVYSLVDVPQERLFGMTTHIDGNILRPYFNAGCLLIDPSRQLFSKWREVFINSFQLPVFQDLYNTNSLYAVFMHQAILSVVILAELRNDEIYELPKEYNYPLHLHTSTDNMSPQKLEELVTARFDNSAELEKIQEPPKFVELIREIRQISI
jgi:hypothetical protein